MPDDTTALLQKSAARSSMLTPASDTKVDRGGDAVKVDDRGYVVLQKSSAYGSISAPASDTKVDRGGDAVKVDRGGDAVLEAVLTELGS